MQNSTLSHYNLKAKNFHQIPTLSLMIQTLHTIKNRINVTSFLSISKTTQTQYEWLLVTDKVDLVINTIRSITEKEFGSSLLVSQNENTYLCCNKLKIIFEHKLTQHTFPYPLKQIQIDSLNQLSLGLAIDTHSFDLSVEHIADLLTPPIDPNYTYIFATCANTIMQGYATDHFLTEFSTVLESLSEHHPNLERFFHQILSLVPTSLIPSALKLFTPLYADEVKLYGDQIKCKFSINESGSAYIYTPCFPGQTSPIESVTFILENELLSEEDLLLLGYVFDLNSLDPAAVCNVVDRSLSTWLKLPLFAFTRLFSTFPVETIELTIAKKYYISFAERIIAKHSNDLPYLFWDFLFQMCRRVDTSNDGPLSKIIPSLYYDPTSTQLHVQINQIDSSKTAFELPDLSIERSLIVSIFSSWETLPVKQITEQFLTLTLDPFQLVEGICLILNMHSTSTIPDRLWNSFIDQLTTTPREVLEKLWHAMIKKNDFDPSSELQRQFISLFPLFLHPKEINFPSSYHIKSSLLLSEFHLEKSLEYLFASTLYPVSSDSFPILGLMEKATHVLIQRKEYHTWLTLAQMQDSRNFLFIDCCISMLLSNPPDIISTFCEDQIELHINQDSSNFFHFYKSLPEASALRLLPNRFKLLSELDQKKILFDIERPSICLAFLIEDPTLKKLIPEFLTSCTKLEMPLFEKILLLADVFQIKDLSFFQAVRDRYSNLQEATPQFWIALHQALPQFVETPNPWKALLITLVQKLPILNLSPECLLFLQKLSYVCRKASGDFQYPKLLPDVSSKAKFNYKMWFFLREIEIETAYIYLDAFLAPTIKNPEELSNLINFLKTKIQTALKIDNPLSFPDSFHYFLNKNVELAKKILLIEESLCKNLIFLTKFHLKLSEEDALHFISKHIQTITPEDAWNLYCELSSHPKIAEILEGYSFIRSNSTAKELYIDAIKCRLSSFVSFETFLSLFSHLEALETPQEILIPLLAKQLNHQKTNQKIANSADLFTPYAEKLFPHLSKNVQIILSSKIPILHSIVWNEQLKNIQSGKIAINDLIQPQSPEEFFEILQLALQSSEVMFYQLNHSFNFQEKIQDPFILSLMKEKIRKEVPNTFKLCEFLQTPDTDFSKSLSLFILQRCDTYAKLKPVINNLLPHLTGNTKKYFLDFLTKQIRQSSFDFDLFLLHKKIFPLLLERGFLYKKALSILLERKEDPHQSIILEVEKPLSPLISKQKSQEIRTLRLNFLLQFYAKKTATPINFFVEECADLFEYGPFHSMVKKHSSSNIILRKITHLLSKKIPDLIKRTQSSDRFFNNLILWISYIPQEELPFLKEALLKRQEECSTVARQKCITFLFNCYISNPTLSDDVQSLLPSIFQYEEHYSNPAFLYFTLHKFIRFLERENSICLNPQFLNQYLSLLNNYLNQSEVSTKILEKLLMVFEAIFQGEPLTINPNSIQTVIRVIQKLPLSNQSSKIHLNFIFSVLVDQKITDLDLFIRFATFDPLQIPQILHHLEEQPASVLLPIFHKIKNNHFSEGSELLFLASFIRNMINKIESISVNDQMFLFLFSIKNDFHLLAFELFQLSRVNPAFIRMICLTDVIHHILKNGDIVRNFVQDLKKYSNNLNQEMKENVSQSINRIPPYYFFNKVISDSIRSLSENFSFRSTHVSNYLIRLSQQFNINLDNPSTDIKSTFAQLIERACGDIPPSERLEISSFLFKGCTMGMCNELIPEIIDRLIVPDIFSKNNPEEEVSIYIEYLTLIFKENMFHLKPFKVSATVVTAILTHLTNNQLSTWLDAINLFSNSNDGIYFEELLAATVNFMMNHVTCPTTPTHVINVALWSVKFNLEITFVKQIHAKINSLDETDPQLNYYKYSLSKLMNMIYPSEDHKTLLMEISLLSLQLEAFVQDKNAANISKIMQTLFNYSWNAEQVKLIVANSINIISKKPNNATAAHFIDIKTNLLSYVSTITCLDIDVIDALYQGFLLYYSISKTKCDTYLSWEDHTEIKLLIPLLKHHPDMILQFIIRFLQFNSPMSVNFIEKLQSFIRHHIADPLFFIEDESILYDTRKKQATDLLIILERNKYNLSHLQSLYPTLVRS